MPQPLLFPFMVILTKFFRIIITIYIFKPSYWIQRKASKNSVNQLSSQVKSEFFEREDFKMKPSIEIKNMSKVNN
jgi:hypothetical protein